MKSMYIVTREGVYRHEVVGLYCTEQQAKTRAVEAVRKEPDDWHSFEVMECPIDEPIEDGTKLLRVLHMEPDIVIEKPRNDSSPYFWELHEVVSGPQSLNSSDEGR